MSFACINSDKRTVYFKVMLKKRSSDFGTDILQNILRLNESGEMV
jgi:demethoxyubiquinone hydroxylase (CLK1/Coq7/Cat5 family)